MTAPLDIDRLIWRFHKSGASGAYTKPMRDFDNVRRELILKVCPLAADEEPVIACIFGENLWTMLTTQRLVWKRGAECGELPIGELADATVDPRDLVAAGTKGGLRKLTVVTKRSDRYVIEIEPGEPFSGFWNVLKTVARASVGR
jgi:hypothetical protein